MVQNSVRSTKHPKPSNTFQLLRAQAKEQDIADPINDWLTRSGTVNASYLQPTHGNRLPPPPLTSCLSRKRKMPDSSETSPQRRSPRRSSPQRDADVGRGVKGKNDVPGRVSRRQPKVDSQTRVKEFDIPGDTAAEGEPSNSEHSIPSDRRLAKGKEPANLSFPHTPIFPMPATTTPSRTSSSPSKKPNSPSKSSSQLNLYKRAHRAFLDPRIKFVTLTDTNKNGYLKGMLQQLWQRINGHEPKIIPAALKDKIKRSFDTPNKRSFDTPNKTKPSISDDHFGAPLDKYATDDLTLMDLTTVDVLKLADQYRHSGCTETHWISIVVSPLLNLVRRLKRYQKTNSEVVVLVITSVEISPSTLCPKSTNSLFKTQDKKPDLAMGLDLPSEKIEVLETGVFLEGLPSINQTAGFTKFVPIFANIEVKRPHTDKDPLIQLGSWIAAEFNKRKQEGYSLDMPVLAVVVEGDAWELYMVFAPEDNGSGAFECRFVGPTEMGTTKSLLGVYKILDKLCCCVDWGINEYQTWFDEQVLMKYQN